MQRIGVTVSEGDQHPAAWGQLVEPVRRDIRTPDGCDDPVVGSGLGNPEEAISGMKANPRIPRVGEEPSGLGHDVVLNVDGDDEAFLTDDFGEEGRVVARTSADLEDPHPGFQL